VAGFGFGNVAVLVGALYLAHGDARYQGIFVSMAAGWRPRYEYMRR
jgi:hypothetical protein